MTPMAVDGAPELSNRIEKGQTKPTARTVSMEDVRGRDDEEQMDEISGFEMAEGGRRWRGQVAQYEVAVGICVLWSDPTATVCLRKSVCLRCAPNSDREQI